MPVINASEFAVIFDRLASQLRWLNYEPDDTQSFFEALRDLPPPLIRESAIRIGKESGRKYFPTTGEWREVVLKIEQELLRKQIGVRTWTVECTACDDSGWIFQECPDEPCQRTKPHYPHTYATECFCRPTNRTFQRHHNKPSLD